MTCLICPASCRLSFENGRVSGFRCRRGREYALETLEGPKRVLTALMRANGVRRPLPVKSNGLIDKSLLLACAAELRRHHPSLPIHDGNVVIGDILSTGIDIVATMDLLPPETHRTQIGSQELDRAGS